MVKVSKICQILLLVAFVCAFAPSSAYADSGMICNDGKVLYSGKCCKYHPAAGKYTDCVLGQLDEVGLAVGVGLGEALAIESGLPLAHHAKHLIVEDDRDDGQLVADSSAGFVEVHVEGAVAGEHDHPLIRSTFLE